MDGDLEKHFLADNSGIAWGLAAAFLLIVLGGAYYLFNLPILNGLVAAINNYEAQGTVSQQTADNLDFGVKVIIFIPVILLLGVFAWVVVRAHEKGGQY